MQKFHEATGIETRLTHGVMPEGRYTFALALDMNRKQVAFGMARVSPTDHFCKKIGRNIAVGRAKKRLVNGSGMSVPAGLSLVAPELRDWVWRELLRLRAV